MARSMGISYGHLIVKNIQTVNVLKCSRQRKFLNTCFRMIPSTTAPIQAPRSFCNLSGNQEIPPPPPPSSSHWGSHWGKWTAGIGVTTMVIPFLQLKEDVDVVMETAEEIIDVVAEAVDTVAEKIAGDLPEGSNLKTTVELVEDVAEAVAGKAQKAVEFIDEIQQAEQKLAPIIEPVKQLTQSVPSGTS